MTAFILDTIQPKCAYWGVPKGSDYAWCQDTHVTHVTTGSPQIQDDYADGLDVYISICDIGHYYCALHAPEDALPITILDASAIRDTMLDAIPTSDTRLAKHIASMILCH